MENIEVDIPKIKTLNDFTIIYKGKKDGNDEDEEGIVEIKTSKEEFLRKLRYFKKHNKEIQSELS